VTNRKAPARRGLVQLIDATSFWVPMRRSLGDKRREIPPDRAQDILQLLAAFRDGETRPVTKDGKTEDVVVSRIFPTTHFGFRKITVERPLRLNFQASAERIAWLEDERGFQALAQSRKKGAAGAREQPRGAEPRRRSASSCGPLPHALVKDRAAFERLLEDASREARLRLPAPVRKAILSALSERDETAAICRDADGNPEPDPEIRRHRERAAAPGRRSCGQRRHPGQRPRVLRARGVAPRPRRLDRHGPARSEGRPGRPGRLGDQLQPVLLPLHASPPTRGDRGRHPGRRGRDPGAPQGPDGRLSRESGLSPLGAITVHWVCPDRAPGTRGRCLNRDGALAVELIGQRHGTRRTQIAGQRDAPALREAVGLLERRAEEAHRAMRAGFLRALRLLDVTMPRPTKRGQHAIADFVDRETARIDAIVAKVREAVERLNQLRTALISAAVTGKIGVREEAA
jgi:hypothetical protein